MSLLNVSGISFQYQSSPVLFEGVSFSINPSDRVAIVGPNGSGKSTLLGLLSGLLLPTEGVIARRRGLTITVSGQQPQSEAGCSLYDSVLETEPDAERALAGLGFSSAEFDLPLDRLSAGQRTRAALARALSPEPDLLLLDEPTNHLDIGAREWLERQLGLRKNACVLISHDRTLLRSFAERIIEVERGRVRAFEGGYDEYRARRALLDRQARAEYDAFQRRKGAAEQAAERRSKLAVRVASAPPGVRGGKDHYRRKAAKVDRTARILRERSTHEEQVQKPWEEPSVGDLTFENVTRSGDTALLALNISKSYGSKALFSGLGLHLRCGERVAVLGPNGAGKTTLLNILTGCEPADTGEIRLGTNVVVARFTQDTEDLDLNRSPLEICGSDTRTRTLLACLKVRPDSVNRPVREMSAGERTKVSLARLLVSGANLLLLDEPTNHLEIEAQEAFEQALALYPGSVIVVSHDRAFLDALGPDVGLVVLGGSP